MARRSKRSSAAKALATRARRKGQREKELRKIERILGEEFTSLRQAKAALQEETQPTDIQDADRWDDVYDDFPDYGDEGEFNSGVET